MLFPGSKLFEELNYFPDLYYVMEFLMLKVYRMAGPNFRW